MSKTTSGSGQKLYKFAKTIIPGGNQLLSKRPEQFLPEKWPSYYKSARGCTIEDLDGNHFRDFSIMGIGTCSLGYSNPEVNNAVINAVQNGSMSTLNCPEEVTLAAKLIDLHGWAGGVRFTRSGGEACSVAVRIARAHRNRELVLFSGYHGWHDWYLATNLHNDKNLDQQLLPGLEPKGVPTALAGSTLPFVEGDFDTFDKYLKNYSNKIAAVIMEVWRYKTPDLAFIKHVINRCNKEGIIVIFDEISSGFRLNIGGSHLIWDLEPDICVLGKALGNGHPIGAIVGKKEIMDAAQSTFISSSYWTERVGYAASLATVSVFENQNVCESLIKTGQEIKKGFSKALENKNLPIEIMGVDSVPIIAFSGNKKNELKTLYTQEMLKKGFLASNVIYVSLAHKPTDVDAFLLSVEETMVTMTHAMANGVENFLDGPICHSGFQRLTKT